MKNNSLLISFFVVYDFWSQCTFAQFVIIQRLNNTTRRGSKHTSIFFTRPSPSSSAETPEERLGSSRSGTSHLRDFLSIEFRPADIPVWPMAIRERLLRAPRPLRLRLRCQKTDRCRSAVPATAGPAHRPCSFASGGQDC